MTLLLACEGGPRVTEPVCDSGAPAPCEPPATPPASCDIAIPAGRTCALWKAADGARTVTRTDTFDILHIERGVQVRVAKDVPIVARRFLIDGTAAAPVRFAPVDPGDRWGGLVLAGTDADTSIMRFVRIESAATGVRAISAGFISPALILEDSHIADVINSGVYIAGGTITRTIIERPGYAGIIVGSNSHARITDATIRDGAGDGIVLGCLRCYAFIGGGTIENNAGDGIVAPGGDMRSPSVAFEAPVRITRNGGRPLVVPLISLRGVMSDSAAQHMLLGNGSDSIVAHSGSTWGTQHVPDGPLVLRDILPARVAVACDMGLMGMLPMSLEPGASLALTGSCPGPYGLYSLPMLNGTAERPVSISGPVTGSGIVLSVPQHAGDTARIRHARIRGIRLYAYRQPTVFENVHFDSARLVLLASGSRLLDVSSSGGGRTGPYTFQQEAAITIAADDVTLTRTRIAGSAHHGVHITAGSARITSCAVTGSAGHGILVDQGTASIDWCNLTDNAGNAIHNATPDTIDAPNVWWGDPAGPRGPDGDNVDGPIRFQPVRTAPVVVFNGPTPTPAPLRASTRPELCTPDRGKLPPSLWTAC